MILHHITQRTSLLIISTTVFNTNIFGSGNLNVINVVAVPNRFKKRIGKTKRKNILNGFFSKVMVDPVDLFFLEYLSEPDIQIGSAFEIMSKRFFKNHS